MNEEFKPIPGFENRYEASNHGNILSWVYPNNGQLLHITTDGRYPSVSLRDSEGNQRCHRVHQLVAAAHLGPMPEDCTLIRHLNDVKTDNRAENLAYGTEADNRADWVRNQSQN